MTKSVHRLAEQFAPAHYTIALDISKRVERVFSGNVTIEGDLHTTDNKIVLHAKGLNITGAAIDGAAVTWHSGDNDELHLVANSDIQPGTHIATLSFDGKIEDPMHGIYPCYFTLDGKPEELLMTQLESHSAREVFPCIDEPAAKATFSLTLTTEPGITVLGNTPIKTQDSSEGTLVTTFQDTPKMSTYLLAFVAGKLEYQEAVNKHGVTIRAYATPDKVDQLGFALGFAAKVLDFYDEYFGAPFPLPKCDLVACPDFSAGAMENWGLITFRESVMLVNEKDAPADLRQQVATVTAHELAHQWFGNLVTMAWWDDLWLNESFANWMEYYATNQFYPEWQLWEQVGATEKQAALTRDSLANVQAVRQAVHHPDEIGALFDPSIVYAKGGSLIHMLQSYLGDEVFREGLRIYMKRHAYSNTTTNDLWRALSEASGKDVEAFMQPWITQPGHPVVDFTVNDGHATVNQKRFYASPTQIKTDNTVWPIPLLSQTIPDVELLTTPDGEFVVEPANYHLLNNGATGFYHTNYDAANLAKIAKAIAQGKLGTLERQRLLLDSVALNRAGISPTINTLQLLNNYAHESNYAIWLAISSALGTLRTITNDDEAYKPHVQRFFARIARSEFERLGWKAKEGESHFDSLLRPTIISYMAYAQAPAVIATCLNMYDQAKKPEDVSPDIRAIVYSVAARERGKPVVNRLLEWYKTTTSADERINLCAGITSIREGELARETLKLLTTKTVKLQDIFYWFIYFIRNRYTREAAWDWMVENWGWIVDKFSGDISDYGAFPKYAASAFGTRQELEMYKEFFEPKLSEIGIARTIQLGMEDIEIRVLWRERDLKTVADFLRKA